MNSKELKNKLDSHFSDEVEIDLLEKKDCYSDSPILYAAVAQTDI
jgi:hypothetical protein